MQPMKQMISWLEAHADESHYLFTPHSLRAICPQLSYSAFKTLLSRAAQTRSLRRLCRGLYLSRTLPTHGLLLFHAAALLRAHEFNYISLETVLSDAGIISQIPMNWISIMSSGRSNIISCGEFGTIEFVHTKQKPNDILNQLFYDKDARLWRASVPLALRDMKATHRNTDLINWDIAHEFI